MDAINNLALGMKWMTPNPMSSCLKMLYICEGYRWYEWFYIMSTRMWMTWMTSGNDLNALDMLSSSRLWLTWTTPRDELRALDVMHNLGLLKTWATSGCVGLWMLWTTYRYGWYEWIEISWAWGPRCYEQLRARIDMNDYKSWAQGSRCYKKLWVLDDMNNSGSWS